MSAQPHPRLTPEQYLEIERAAVDVRSEFYEGRMYAMSGGTYPHALIISTLGRKLGNALEHGPCEVTTSDLRVKVAPNGLYAYPDIVVVCGVPRFADGRKDMIENPILIIEVLSPSTEAYDRGFKAQQYRRIESLQEYAFVSQAEARVEVFRRQMGGNWLFSEAVGMESVCRFESVEAGIALAEIYSKVTFAAEPEPGPSGGD